MAGVATDVEATADENLGEENGRKEDRRGKATPKLRSHGSAGFPGVPATILPKRHLLGALPSMKAVASDHSWKRTSPARARGAGVGRCIGYRDAGMYG